jgi:uncharacterized protein
MNARTDLIVEFAGLRLTLLPARAAIFDRTLLIADPHFGKDTLFNARGVSMPANITGGDIARLGALLDDYKPARLVILGDLLHGKESLDQDMIQLLGQWRRRYAHIEMIVTRGNHDAHCGDPPESVGLTMLDDWFHDAVRFRHHPGDDGVPTIAGHLHPGARIGDFDGSGATLPCFQVDHDNLILPAFGRFTGSVRVPPRPGRRLIVIGDGRVVELR